MNALSDPGVSVPPVLLHSSPGEWGMTDYREQVATRDSISYFLTKFYIALFTVDPKKKDRELVRGKKSGPCLPQDRKKQLAEEARIIL